MAAEALTVASDRTIHREVLANGLTVLTEQMDHIRSVSMGIWLKAGSRNEEAEVNGISHFVEHMVFKGTTHRTAEDIAREVDSIGGNMDAFTGKETVCFNIKVLDEHLPIAVDVLSDMVLHPIFDANEIVRERGVIVEEIKMDEDNPDSLVHEIFTQNFFKNHPLGRPILGTKETVRKFDQAAIRNFYQSKFVPENMVISAAGHVKHEVFVDLLRKEFEVLPRGTNGAADCPPKINSRIVLRNKKALEQVQICIGVPSYRVNHERRFVAYVLNTLLGGGMSSRLFQNVREKQGLVYSIFSELNPYKDTGCLAVYAGTSRESAPKVVQSVMHEFREIKGGQLGGDEVKRAKDQLKGSLMLSLESSTARMSNLARQELYHDHFMGMDEIIARVQEVTQDDVVQAANEMFQQESIAVTVLGNLNGLKLTREMLAC
jgi:predicted Zn-dependent peptidase